MARDRAQVVAGGATEAELAWLARAGLAVPGADDCYRGDDLALLSTLGAARCAGNTADMLPFGILSEYLAALNALVQLVIVSPGFQMARTQYTSYARHLATWGFVAILTDYGDTSFFPSHDALAADVTKVIDWALAGSLGIDATRIGAVGHSLGGKISVLAAAQEPRIRAIVAWDPVDSNSPSVVPQRLASFTAALAVVGETTNAAGGGMPCAPAAENFEQFYAAAPSPALAITVLGADHMDWVDDPSCGFCGFCTAGSAAPELARAVSRRLDVAWLRRQLFADTSMDPWLAAPPELAGGAITLQQK